MAYREKRVTAHDVILDLGVSKVEFKEIIVGYNLDEGYPCGEYVLSATYYRKRTGKDIEVKGHILDEINNRTQDCLNDIANEQEIEEAEYRKEMRALDRDYRADIMRGLR